MSGILWVVVDGTGVLDEGFGAGEVTIMGFSEDSGFCVEDGDASTGFAVVVLCGLIVRSE